MGSLGPVCSFEQETNISTSAQEDQELVTESGYQIKSIPSLNNGSTRALIVSWGMLDCEKWRHMELIQSK